MRDFLFFILYLSDGAAWLLGLWMALTGFFGYRAPKSKKRPLWFAIGIFAYGLVNLGLHLYAEQHNQSFGIIFEGIILFVMVYWMCQPIYFQEGRKKLKIREKIFLAVCSIEMYCGIVNISNWGYQMILRTCGTERKGEEILFFIAFMNLVPIFTIFFFSRLSSKNRKEPMAFSVCFACFLFFMLLDTAINLLQLREDIGVTPIVKFRIIIDDMEGPSEVVSVIAYFFVIIICLLAIVFIVKESERLYLQKKDAMNEYYLEMQKKHYESLVESNREIRKIKHDMKNHLYCIEQLRAMGHYGELEAYIKELSEHLEQADITVHTGCEIADAIISDRKRQAFEQGIKFEVEGNISNLKVSALHICTIFSNILDNALEAVEKLDGADKWVTMKLKKNENFYLIEVTNPTKEPIEIVENRVISTKFDKENHGFGLENVKEAVAQYEGDVKLSQQDGVFWVEVMIPCSEN